MPSLTALLGMLAIAGYQNRDKLAELLKNAKDGLNSKDATASPGDANSSILSDLAGMVGGTQAGDLVTEAVKGLVDGFKGSGNEKITDSWVKQGPNAPVKADQFEQAVGKDLIDELSAKTGLSRAELLKRLTSNVPRLVDDMTPEGRLPY